MQGKNVISITLTVIIASAVIIGGAYAIKNKWYSQENPGLTVLNFYEQWVKHENNPLEDRIYQDHPAIAKEFENRLDQILDEFERGAYDPILCAQEKPQSIEIKDIKKITENQAQIILTADYFGDKKDLTIDLKKENGNWQIIDIVCPKTKDPNKDLVEQYIRDNISELSPEEAVLGGNFFVTNVEFLSDNSVLVDYEDGHIALQAEAGFTVSDEGEVSIAYFDLIEEEEEELDRQEAAEQYIRDNISELSPEEAEIGRAHL